MIESDASWRLFDTIKSIASSNGQSANAMATCVRVLSDGTRMMQLVGSSILTPLNGSMAAEIGQGDMAEVRIEDGVMSLTANVSNPSVGQSEVNDAVADKATVRQLGESNARIEHLEVTALTAESATIANLQADTAKVHDLTADQLTAATAYVGALDAGNVTAAQLIADHATVGALDSTYAKVDMANVNNAWISNGTIKDAAISDGMINSVSANKLTAGTIDASKITVSNLNADNITAGTINGQRIGQGSLSLDKLSEDVYTESEVDSKLATMQAEIDGAIETWTGTAVPTLNNAPANGWTTDKIKDTHVGDVYFVVNSNSQQNGYNYRFSKSTSGGQTTYSWQLIKDSDVTNALQRLSTAEGKITTFDSDISTLKTDTGTLKTKTESLETRMSDAEDDILDKVDTTTFNEVSDTVDQHSQTITQMSQTLSNKADGSTVTALTTRVSKTEQDITGVSTTIGELQTTVESKADISTVETVSNKLNTVSDTVDGHTQTLTSVQNTLSTKADSSTVSTLTTQVNTIEDTVDGHTQTIEGQSTVLTNNGLTSSTNITSRVSSVEQDLSGYKTTVSETYATKTAVNGKADASDVTALAGRVTTAETSIQQNRDAIALRATKTEAYQVAQPNLTPWFNVEPYTTAAGYWYKIVADELTSLGDGWVHISKNNTGSSTAFVNYFIALRGMPTDLKPSTNYTFLVEKKNVVRNTSVTGYTLIVTVTGSHSTEVDAFSAGVSGNFNEGAQYLQRTTKSDLSTAKLFTRGYISVPAGGSVEMDLRISLYEGEYTGPYKPYAGPQLYATNAELKVTAEGISSTVERVGGFKYLESASAGASLSNIKTYAADGRVINWSVKSTNDVRVGDFIYLKYKDTTRNCDIYVKGKVIAINSSTNIKLESHGYEDVLPVETIKSTINQSADSVKIQAKHIEIDGTAIFTAISSDVDEAITDKGYQTSSQVESAITSKGYATTTQAQGYASTAQSNAISAAAANAVARSQRIYYRKTSSGAPAANTTWLATSGTGYGNWSLNVPQLTSNGTKYPYLYTAVQTQTVAQQAAGTACSCSAVLIDDSSTVIDGGNIITGTVSANAINAASGTFDKANIPTLTADHIKANVISAVNKGTGTINANKINADGLTIGYSQIENPPTIPSTVAELSDASDYAKQSALTTEINQRKAAYATSSTAAGTQAKAATCANFALYTGASVTVTFSNANTHATPTLNVNSTGAKSIRGYTGAALTAAEYKWAAGAAITFVYDGSYWRMQDGGAQQAKADAANAARTATNYITHVNDNGITIHPQSGTSNRVAINADGMEVFKGDVSVASYGDTARIGKQAGPRVLLTDTGINLCGDSSDYVSAEVGTYTAGDGSYGFINTDSIGLREQLIVGSIGNLFTPRIDVGYGIGTTMTISGIRFGYSSGVTNSNGITYFNPGFGTTDAPTAVFVMHVKASNETEAVAKIAVPMVWSIAASQIQIRWKRTDTSQWLTQNTVGWCWLAIYSGF